MIILKSLLIENLIHKLGDDTEILHSDFPVDWNAVDVQILTKWDEQQIKEFIPLNDNYTAIYKSIVDVNDLDPRFDEEEEEFSDGGYDWTEYKKRSRGFPPILIRRNVYGRIHILDGNHRVKWAQMNNYKTISAWVVDDEIQKEINSKYL